MRFIVIWIVLAVAASACDTASDPVAETPRAEAGSGARDFEDDAESAAEPGGVQLTLVQENAERSAKSYLSFAGFSRQGLIEQLEYEEYSTDDATAAVDSLDVDWMAEAVESAESYLEFSGFSCDGLIGQLEYEGFTAAQAEHGASQTGICDA